LGSTQPWADALRLGVDWLADQQQPSGGLPRHVPGTGICYSDVSAQAARLFLWVEPQRHAIHAKHAFEYLERLKTFEGGLYYHADCADQPTWAVIFAAQARLIRGGLEEMPCLV
jgi:hypothetical protein